MNQHWVLFIFLTILCTLLYQNGVSVTVNDKHGQFDKHFLEITIFCLKMLTLYWHQIHIRYVQWMAILPVCAFSLDDGLVLICPPSAHVFVQLVPRWWHCKGHIWSHRGGWVSLEYLIANLTSALHRQPLN